MHRINLLKKINSEKRRSHYIEFVKLCSKDVELRNIDKIEKDNEEVLVYYFVCKIIHNRKKIIYGDKKDDIDIYGIREKYIDTEGDPRIKFTLFAEDKSIGNELYLGGKEIYFANEMNFNSTIYSGFALNDYFENYIDEIFYNRHKNITDLSDVAKILS